LFRVSNTRLQRLQKDGDPRLLAGGRKGIEKECLRVTPAGGVAHTPHPRALGAALTHPSITTDYSEALLEFITPPYVRLSETLQHLADIHSFVYSKLDNELLWPTSMPCIAGGDAAVPIAEYGSSNVGRMKHVYRVGLDHRYGRIMQAIAGVHFNYSLPEAFWPMLQSLEEDGGALDGFRSRGYFGLIRNFQRHGWLIPYLFGASPALCKSFLNGRPHDFEQFDRGTLYTPYATSLRMSDIGYKNKAQAGLRICYNSIDTYIESLNRAISTPDPTYAAIGTFVDGQWRQLNANILQIENEYYSFIRPKAITRPAERPSLALRRAGVEYVEVRALDINAYDPMGLNEAQLRFVEAFLLLCLLEDSPPISGDELREIEHNQAIVARRGREPALRLQRSGGNMLLQDWALQLCEAMSGICELLDQSMPGRPYQDALAAQIEAVRDPDRTPSARMLAEMRRREETFIAFGRRMAKENAEHFRQRPLGAARQAEFEALAASSLREQQELEADTGVSFEEYLQAYFAQR
jgi:glutamate--cysteine ligase